MTFCKKCGRYNQDTAICDRCGANLKVSGHPTLQGGFVSAKAMPMSAVSSRAVRGAETAAGGMVAVVGVPMEADILAPAPQANELFNHDRFLLRQKALAINEKYYVSDEEGVPIVFVERPAMLVQQLTMLTGVAVAFFGGNFAVSFLSDVLGARLGPAFSSIVSLLGFVLVLALTAAAFFKLVPKRHVAFYTDETKTKKLLEIKQLNKIEFPYANFTVLDEEGNIIGKLRKNLLFDYVRRRWYCSNAYGVNLFVAKEDSIILSLLRRTIPILAFLRTNFVFIRGEEVIGEFNRKLTILDRYVLDMSFDPQRTVDRRLALATGVMLDTGERR